MAPTPPSRLPRGWIDTAVSLSSLASQRPGQPRSARGREVFDEMRESHHRRELLACWGRRTLRFGSGGIILPIIPEHHSPAGAILQAGFLAVISVFCIGNNLAVIKTMKTAKRKAWQGGVQKNPAAKEGP
uniref:Uncharacterized protein n=1 Tax=Oryza meridionalis TaxID=40149 RepID=A0A0E0DC66_9ORYZ